MSCRVVVVSAAVDRFRGILVPLLGPMVLAVTGTVGWQVEVGRGREGGCLDTGRKQPPAQEMVRALLSASAK